MPVSWWLASAPAVRPIAQLPPGPSVQPSRGVVARLRNRRPHRRIRAAPGIRARPSLAGPLPIPPGLFGIDFAHFLEQLLRVRTRHIGRFWAVTIPLLRSPGSDRLLNALRHEKS